MQNNQTEVNTNHQNLTVIPNQTEAQLKLLNINQHSFAQQHRLSLLNFHQKKIVLVYLGIDKETQIS